MLARVGLFITARRLSRATMIFTACVVGFLLTPLGNAAEIEADAGTDLLSLEMGESRTTTESGLLFVDPAKVVKERKALKAKLPKERRKKELRPLYEKYIDKIGANGILDGIEELWPKCHSQAHDLGKVIYARLGNIGLGLSVCADRCYSGCMHGVLMEAFRTLQTSTYDHINVRELRSVMNDVCYENKVMTAAYRPPDCAHGVGHALMFLTKYKIPKAIDACAGFSDPAMKYACVTGAYMEYVTEQHHEDKKTKSLFYPCDSHPYPTACGRYKLPLVTLDYYRQGKTLEQLIAKCLELEGKFRRGCFHGLGNAHMYFIVRKLVSINDVCHSGTEQEQMLCIDGAMERMGKYHGDRALEACEALQGGHRQLCRDAAARKMYHKDKDLTLYLVP
jgi:hypothetical protein